MVSQRRHRAGQRAGDRRALRALRPPRRGAAARAVVLPHHRVRRPAAGGHAHDRVARARGHDAGELDRPLRGRRGDLPLRAARDRLSRVHHSPGHPVRSHLLRDGAGASGRVPPQRLARGARVRQPRPQRVGRGARLRAHAEDRRGAGADRHQPGHRRADPDVRGRLRADGVRHGGDHGRAGSRRARPRLRRAVRPGDQTRGRLRRPALRRRGPPGQLGRLHRHACVRGQARDHRLARGGADRQALDQLPAARLAAVAPALLGLPDPGRLLRRARHRGGAGRPAPGRAARRGELHPQGQVAAGGSRGLGRHDVPDLRGAGAARDRHDGHVRRLVLVLPALLRPGQRPGSLRPRDRRLLDARGPVHRRRRARDPAPDVRALLRQGAGRHGLPGRRRSRSRGCSPRA